MKNNINEFIDEFTTNFSELFIETFLLRYLANFEKEEMSKAIITLKKELNKKITMKLKSLGFDNI